MHQATHPTLELGVGQLVVMLLVAVVGSGGLGPYIDIHLPFKKYANIN